MKELIQKGSLQALFDLAVMGPFRPSKASGADLPAGIDLPAPLAKQIKRGGMLYREIFRHGGIAIYEARGKGSRIEYEVIEVQVLPAQEIGGKSYPVREAFQSNSDWGEQGHTFTNNSHCDPLAAAAAKAQEMLAKTGSKEGKI